MIGVVTEVSSINSINTKLGPRDRVTVLIADDSKLAMNVTIWGQTAQITKELKEGMVVAFRNAKISDYNGKSLNCSDDATGICIEPNHPRTLALQKWYAFLDNAKSLQSLSNQISSGDRSDLHRLIQEVHEHLVQGEVAETLA